METPLSKKKRGDALPGDAPESAAKKGEDLSRAL